MASIVRVGASNDAFGQQLIEALDHYLTSSSGSSPNTNKNTKKATNFSISNRYFDATVALCPLSLPQTAAGTAEVEGNEDGMILIFDDASKESFDVLAGLHGMAETNSQNGDLLRLCVGLVTSEDEVIDKSSKAYEDEYSRRVLWCLDHGYEFVESVNVLTKEKLQVGHDTREKEGFARVIEALQGTVWSSANMHAKAKQTLKQSYQEAREKATTQPQQNTTTTTTTTTDNDMMNEYEPPPTTSLMELAISDRESKEREEQARKTLLEQDGIAENDDDAIVPSTTTNPQEEAAQERKADKIMSDMESALAEATRIRAMSQQGVLSDDDRKQRAGDAAMLLMNLMNQMGEDESDDEEENNDSD